jgi:hypothetical protein
MLKGEDLAVAVLRAKDRYALLSLGSATPIKLDSEGYLNLEDEDVRRAYMRIATQIHPDKLCGFPDATKAFQALVRAYELCCKPDLREDDSDDSREDDEDDEDNGEGASDGEAEDESDYEAEDESDYEEEAGVEVLSDSSDDDKPLAALAAAKSPRAATPSAAPPPKKPKKEEQKAKAPATHKKKAAGWKLGSVRTGVKCPRCFAGWGDHLKAEGNEAMYTEFMRGLRQVHCQACLFEFGSLTASHHCPKCDRPFEYRPQHFRKRGCCPNTKQRGKPACGATFGFANITRSAKRQEAEDSALKRQAQERRQREDAAESRRKRSSGRRGEDVDEEEEAWLEELGQFIVTEVRFAARITASIC